MHFCPHVDCDYQGWLGLGNLRANGHPSGGPWRQLYCRSCKGYFLETHGTLFHGKRVAMELIVRVLACLAEGLGIRATARVFEVDPNTVLQWLVEAAEQLQAFSAFFLCDIHVRQLQLDELYAMLRSVRDGEISTKKAIKRLERSRHWVWTAIDPESKLLLVIDSGPRTLAMAQRVVHHIAQMLAPDCAPLFFRHQWVPAGVALPHEGLNDADVLAAIIRITGGNFRLLHRLLTQVARLVEINALSRVTREVIEAARESLVIGTT
jgi:hypothetical protein